MIAPLPQLPVPPLSGDTPGRQPDAREGGDGFAEILAAAAPPAGQLPGPPPIPEHGPAVVHVTADPEAAARAITDPADAVEARAEGSGPAAAAEIFNQQGLLGTATAAGTEAAPGVDTRPAHVAPSRRIVEGVAAASAEAGNLQLPAQISHASAVANAVNRPVAPGARSARPAAVPAAGPVAVTPSRIDAETSADPVKPAGRRLPVREAAARSAVQVVLRELEQGLHIAARTDALDDAERLRLHDEIAALLARHGLAARSIRISAPGRSAPLQEKFR